MKAVYIRVSTNKQQTESQKRDLTTWTTNHSDVLWYQDKFTGKTMDRPGWLKLWTAICDGRVDTIVCWRLDRLGRTARGLLTLRDELVARKVNLISLRDNLDLATPSGRMMFALIATIAEYETEVRRERQLAGIAAAREQGKRIGGRKTGAMGERTKLALPAIHAMLGAGESIARIADTTGLSRQTIYTLLKEAKPNNES